MKKVKTTYEQAITDYAIHYEKIPTVIEINDKYHKYCFTWKQFNGFIDWMIYND